METSRRYWLKQIGLGVTGIGLANIQSVASPAIQSFIDNAGGENMPVILRSNENPYGPSPLARKAFADNLMISNRYNWDVAAQLISDIAKKCKVKDENILLGAGSTEILDIVARLAALEKGSYVIADPSFDYWTVTLDNAGLKKIKVPLTAGKGTDLPAMLTAVGADTRLVYICNPNNPTGTMCEREALAGFIARIPKNIIVLVDEAYLDFTKQPSLSSLINEHPNMVIAKTFSKIYGLAGARIGYAIANSAMIDKLAGLRSNANNCVSILSKFAAMASLKDDRFLADCYSLNETVRAYTLNELEKLNLACIPSHTNFIYFSLSNFKKDYFQRLKDNNIEGSKIYEEQGKWTRITIGRMEEMKRFIKAIQ